MAGPKTRNNGQWTEARFKSFVKGALRQASVKWGPINDTKKNARIGRNEYLCAMCGLTVPSTTVVEEGGRTKRVSNIHVDHIHPVIDPEVGFVSWDSVVDRLFCETDGLRLLCRSCHTIVTEEEKAIAKERRKNSKGDDVED